MTKRDNKFKGRGMKPMLLVERDFTPNKVAGVDVVMPKFRVLWLEGLDTGLPDSLQRKKIALDKGIIPVSLEINGICASFVMALGN